MHVTTNINSPKVTFSPIKMVYETISVQEPDFTHRLNKPPFEIIYFQLEPGDSTPKDRHVDVEIWIILSGLGKLIYDEQEVLLSPHDIVHFTPNRYHQVFNDSQVPLLICSLSWL